MTYQCKTCRSSQHWYQCEKCGEILCSTCASKGVGGYPKMRASNTCPYCNKTSTFGLKRLTGHEDILKPLSK